MTARLACGLLLVAVIGAAPAAELGRLFLTPAERQAIDAALAARHPPLGAAPPPQVSAVSDTEGAPGTPPAPTQGPVTVNGYVARSAGAPTVWVNGSDAAAGRLSPPRADGRRVAVPLGTGQVSLKPGQSFDPDTRRVSDAYEQPAHAAQ
ncbi:MAG: hypothetical protein AB7I01_16290 [Gammaproteobacteria bacterium]